MAAKRPLLAMVWGASHSPAQYGYLSHLLQPRVYPVFSAQLPSVGAAEQIFVEDDAAYVRERMLLPVPDYEEYDVTILMHSYSSAPGSAAVTGLGKKERAAQGKKTGVIGQIYLAALLSKGCNGKDIVSAFSGQYPPHI